MHFETRFFVKVILFKISILSFFFPFRSLISKQRLLVSHYYQKWLNDINSGNHTIGHLLTNHVLHLQFMLSLYHILSKSKPNNYLPLSTSFQSKAFQSALQNQMFIYVHVHVPVHSQDALYHTLVSVDVK